MSDKPKMYQNTLKKVFNNNKKIFVSYNDNNSNIVSSSNDIRKKINNIVNSNNFIYRTKVNIVIDNDILVKKIVGIYNNNLVTLDNEYIPIDKIRDIYK